MCFEIACREYLQKGKALKLIEFQGFSTGRSIGIRTRGLLDPNQARYQTSPYPVSQNIILDISSIVKCWTIFPGHFIPSVTRIIFWGDKMGYKIRYDSFGPKSCVRKYQKVKMKKMKLVFWVVLLLLLLIPAYKSEALKELLIPGDTAVTEQAAENLVANLKDGLAFKDAVEAVHRAPSTICCRSDRSPASSMA